MSEDNKIEVKKSIIKKKNGQETDEVETTITKDRKSWRSIGLNELETRIVNAYLEAIDLAEDEYLVEKTDSSKKEGNKAIDGSSKSDKKEANETTTTDTEKITYRDNLSHYEKLYRCYIDMKKVGVKKAVIICATIVICITIVSCLFSPRFNSQKYEASQTSSFTTNIDDTSCSIENTLSIGNK